jgi:amino acid adenylation domain-containing protein
LKPPVSKSVGSEALPVGTEQSAVFLEPANGNYSRRQLVPELFSMRASLAPDAPALVSAAQTLTYREVEVRANQLAHHLRALGVGPETMVGLCLGRVPSMVVAALAILKAGGAYIPLEPDYPAERLRFMLEDARISVLITRKETNARIGSGRWKIIDRERDAAQIARNPETVPAAGVSEEGLAYVIYTSGSTGHPKGVEITHKSLLNLISWHQHAFDLSPADRASQLASVGFDAAVWEVWPNLTAGSSVHFPDEATRVSPEPLRDWLVSEGITVSFVPTPLAEALITLPWPNKTALRLLLTGGDTLHHYPVAGLPFVLINNYGPTECTVVATSGPVAPDPHPAGLPLIGRPIDNFKIYILDEHLQQVPPGTVGELHIAGQGLARGYLNRPDLSAQKFIANPFSRVPGERMYKTGDLARYLPDGQIAFVGRRDEQIKIRGYRIEPEEVVMALDQCYGVESSLVVARKDNSGDTRLIAYLVPTLDATLTHNSLQRYLKRSLPDYMVPATFVRLPALPTGASGKVDRSSLPLPGPENTIGDEVRVGPSTPVEERVVAILSELLGLENVGVNDNFFFLGGHSLLGTQLIARARDSFGIELPLRTVFDSPTASQLSAEIERMLRHRSSAD